MFDKIFVSPQVKRIVIISNNYGIYELPHEMPNEFLDRPLQNPNCLIVSRTLN